VRGFLTPHILNSSYFSKLLILKQVNATGTQRWVRDVALHLFIDIHVNILTYIYLRVHTSFLDIIICNDDRYHVIYTLLAILCCSMRSERGKRIKNTFCVT